MKIHWVVFILFHLHGQMDGVIVMGTSQIQIRKEREEKNSVIVTVFTRQSSQALFCVF